MNRITTFRTNEEREAMLSPEDEAEVRDALVARRRADEVLSRYEALPSRSGANAVGLCAEAVQEERPDYVKRAGAVLLAMAEQHIGRQSVSAARVLLRYPAFVCGGAGKRIDARDVTKKLIRPKEKKGSAPSAEAVAAREEVKRMLEGGT